MKARLRRDIRARKERADPDALRRAGAAIQERLLALPGLARADALAAYLALPDEAPTDRILAWARRRGIRVAVPARDDAGAWAFAALHPETPLREGTPGLTHFRQSLTRCSVDIANQRLKNRIRNAHNKQKRERFQ